MSFSGIAHTVFVSRCYGNGGDPPPKAAVVSTTMASLRHAGCGTLTVPARVVSTTMASLTLCWRRDAHRPSTGGCSLNLSIFQTSKPDYSQNKHDSPKLCLHSLLSQTHLLSNTQSLKHHALNTSAMIWPARALLCAWPSCRACILYKGPVTRQYVHRLKMALTFGSNVNLSTGSMSRMP